MITDNNGGVQHQINKKGGSLRIYQQTAVGSMSLFELAVYESIECFINPLPGKIGKLLRSRFYPFIFKKCSKSVKISHNITIYQPSKIILGADVEIAESVTLNIKSRGEGIILQEKVKIGKEVIISCPGGTVNVGKETEIEQKCRLGSLMGLTIGNKCRIGCSSYLIGAAHTYSSVDLPIINQPLSCRGKTIIGDHVTIGSGVTIRDGIKIGNNAQIGDGSLVITDVAAGDFVAGIPAVSKRI